MHCARGPHSFVCRLSLQWKETKNCGSGLVEATRYERGMGMGGLVGMI